MYSEDFTNRLSQIKEANDKVFGSLLKDTEIYKNVFKTKDEAKIKFLKKLCVAYNNFKLYLKDDKVEINYTYLWDLICRPNSELFPKGINMAILEIKNELSLKIFSY